MDRRDWAPVQAMIDRHEGRRLYLYYDTKQLPTIGAGRNLAAKGISVMELDYLRDNDISDAIHELMQYSWYSGLNQPRQAALIDMMFTLGPRRFEGFVHMTSALAAGDCLTASKAGLDSTWHGEAPKRCEFDMQLLATGEWPK